MTTIEKQQAYKKLIEIRKNYDFKKNYETENFKNYSGLGFETEYVDGWEQWHNNLDAEIMLVGQDFANWETLKKDEGKIEPHKEIYKYQTNKRLVELFKQIGGAAGGIDLGHPLKPNKNASLFFTNAVVGLKSGNMQAKIEKKWIEKSAENFLKPLINIVQPKIIITLGRISFDSVYCALSGQQFTPKSISLGKIVKNTFYEVSNTKIYPVFHCGNNGIRTRKFETNDSQIPSQKSDWQKISLL